MRTWDSWLAWRARPWPSTGSLKNSLASYSIPRYQPGGIGSGCCSRVQPRARRQLRYASWTMIPYVGARLLRTGGAVAIEVVEGRGRLEREVLGSLGLEQVDARQDPETSKRTVMRRPDLAIVDDDLWKRAQAHLAVVRAAYGAAGQQKRRRGHVSTVTRTSPRWARQPVRRFAPACAR